MAAPAQKKVALAWQGRGMVFKGETASHAPCLVDGDSAEAPSPMDALLVALAGCTGSDVIVVARKKRLDLRDFRIEVTGDRRDEYPRRYTKIHMVYHVTAPGATEPAVRHAIDLSLEKYCSVTHSLAPDIAVTYELHLQA